ncbi:MAG TPA: hypothetical protein VEQ59_14995 [Polyangiaceae bacterium]|nr:hypothetical protein [Polyangiaceae bacterium]
MKRARLPAIFALSPALALAPLALLGFQQTAHAAGPDPAAEVQTLLAKLDAPATRSLVQEPVAKAKAAQQRAQSARGAGDLQHATELDTLALTWAKVAEDLVRTAESEKKLAEVQKAVSELEQKAVRTQALIEQTIARRGRAELNLHNASPGTGTGTGTASKSDSEKPGKPPSKTPAPASQVKPSQPAVKK